MLTTQLYTCCANTRLRDWQIHLALTVEYKKQLGKYIVLPVNLLRLQPVLFVKKISWLPLNSYIEHAWKENLCY